jgi:hypothetical protein
MSRFPDPRASSLRYRHHADLSGMEALEVRPRRPLPHHAQQRPQHPGKVRLGDCPDLGVGHLGPLERLGGAVQPLGDAAEDTARCLPEPTGEGRAIRCQKQVHSRRLDSEAYDLAPAAWKTATQHPDPASTVPDHGQDAGLRAVEQIGRDDGRSSDTRLASVVSRWLGGSVGAWDPA